MSERRSAPTRRPAVEVRHPVVGLPCAPVSCTGTSTLTQTASACATPPSSRCTGGGKHGAAFGYTGVRGWHPQLATCAQTGQVQMCRLRAGSAGAARGEAPFLTETAPAAGSWRACAGTTRFTPPK